MRAQKILPALFILALLVVLVPSGASAKKKRKPKPLEDYVAIELLGLCGEEERLVLLERRLDLPYHFDRVDLVLRDISRGKGKRKKNKARTPILTERGREPLLAPSLVRRLRRRGLKPLYDVELADLIAARRAELHEQGCEPGVAIAVDDALDFVFELAETPYRVTVSDDKERMTVSCAITGPNARNLPNPVREERLTLLWYAESALSQRPLRPERIVQVLIFPKASMLALVIRSVDPPRYDVPGVDYLVVFPL
jgi:hypothetical protein